MASLVAWLSYSGARRSDGTTVASGRAYFYQPGTTSTQVSVYGDKDGLIAIIQPVALDAGGRAEVYTRGPCRVEVQDSTGAVVRLEDRANTITAAQVEIENAIATGTSLTTGLQVQGGRTDLNTFLTNLATSLGTVDGNVLVSGTGVPIATVLGSSSGVFFNVRVAPYSAVGDGVTDDTAHVQAAINAAQTAGGGIVYFPPGTYNITSALAVTSNKIQFLGVSPSASIISQSTAAAYCLTITGADFFSQGIGFAALAASANLVTTTATDGRFSNCGFALGTGTGCNLTAAVARLTFVNCYFNQALATGSMFRAGVSGSRLTVLGGRVTIPTASSAFVVTGVAGAFAHFVGVEFYHAAAGGTTIIAANTSGLVTVFSGCVLMPTGGGLLYISHGTGFYELGNYLGTNCSVGFSSALSLTRNASAARAVLTATTYTPDAASSFMNDVSSTAASFLWNAPGSVGGVQLASGTTLMLRYKNASAGAVTPTFNSIYKIGTAPSVGAGQSATWTFMYDPIASYWVQTGGNPIAITTP